MQLNEKRGNFIVTLFKLTRSIIIGAIIGIGMTLAVVGVTLFRIVRDLFKPKTSGVKKIHKQLDEK